MPRKSNRRELLIGIATTRFLVSGYDVVTVDELCELSSSTKGSFYHFFTNKEALAVDVVNEVWHQTQIEMEAIFHTEQSARSQLASEIDRVASSYIRDEGKRHFVGCPVGTLAVSLRGKNMKLTRRLNFAMNHMRQFYLDAYEAGVHRGEFEGSANLLADRFQVMVQGLSTMGKARSGNTLVRDLAENLKASL